MTSYNQLPYDTRPVAATHPDRLATVAILLGLDPAPIGSARVLELGCGNGRNLMPMASNHPDATFVGLDLSQVQIGQGRQLAVKLDNLELIAGDLAEFSSEQPFDYIIAHGVYSWVPPAVQQALLAVTARCLSPDGIAYISYATLPGAYSRRALSEMLRWGVPEQPDPVRRVEQARDFAGFLGRHLSNRAPASATLRQLMIEVGGMSDAYVMHDHLSSVNEPVMFSDFVRRAHAESLQYLGDPQFHTMFPSDVDLAALNEVAGDHLQLEQLLDFVLQRPFRTSLLCHSPVAIDRSLTPARLLPLCASTTAEARGLDFGEWSYRSRGRPVFTTRSAVIAQAFDTLVGSDVAVPVASLAPAEHSAELCEVLLSAYVAQQIELSTLPG